MEKPRHRSINEIEKSTTATPELALWPHPARAGEPRGAHQAGPRLELALWPHPARAGEPHGAHAVGPRLELALWPHPARAGELGKLGGIVVAGQPTAKTGRGNGSYIN